MCKGNFLAYSASGYLVMLVKLATECDSEVAGSTGDCTGGVQGLAAVVGAPSLADLHILEARLHARVDSVSFSFKAETNAHSRIASGDYRHLLGAMRIIHKVTHGDKGVAQSFCGSDSFICVQTEHPLQQVYELSSVGFLS